MHEAARAALTRAYATDQDDRGLPRDDRRDFVESVSGFVSSPLDCLDEEDQAHEEEIASQET